MSITIRHSITILSSGTQYINERNKKMGLKNLYLLSLRVYETDNKTV